MFISFQWLNQKYSSIFLSASPQKKKKKKKTDITTVLLWWIFCHWNLNELTAHDSSKISLLQAYIIQHNYGIICLAETFRNSSILSDNKRITIDRHNLIRSDHSRDAKKRGVCIYYKEHTPLILRDDEHVGWLRGYRNWFTKWKMLSFLYLSFPKSKSGRYTS